MLFLTHNTVLQKDLPWRFRIEIIFLVLFLFFLPLREAPKNIFLGLYCAVWIFNRFTLKNFGGGWGRWETLSVLLITSVFLSTQFGGLVAEGHNRKWHALGDILSYTTLFLCLSRSGYSLSIWKKLIVSSIGSCLIAELEGVFLYKVSHLKQALELHSVGHVNHSAIYLAITLGFQASFITGFWHSMNKKERFFCVISLVILMMGVFMSDSRAAIGSSLVMAFIILCARGLKKALDWRLWACCGAVIFIGLLLGGNGFIKKQESYASSEAGVLSYRDSIWRRGLLAFKENTYFGVGPSNYIQITDSKIHEWLAKKGGEYNSKVYFHKMSHAHSIYINTLAERGAVGFLSVLLFLGTWFFSLFQRPRNPEHSEAGIAFRGMAFSGWLTTTLVGTVNTTFHHEQAMLSLVGLAGWVALTRYAQNAADPAEVIPASKGEAGSPVALNRVPSGSPFLA